MTKLSAMKHYTGDCTASWWQLLTEKLGSARSVFHCWLQLWGLGHGLWIKWEGNLFNHLNILTELLCEREIKFCCVWTIDTAAYLPTHPTKNTALNSTVGNVLLWIPTFLSNLNKRQICLGYIIHSSSFLLSEMIRSEVSWEAIMTWVTEERTYKKEHIRRDQDPESVGEGDLCVLCSFARNTLQPMWWTW